MSVFPVLHENLEKCVIYAALAVLSDSTAAVAVVVGMWKPASFAGFQAARAGKTVVADVPLIPPSERHFHSESPVHRPFWRESVVWAAGGAE